MNTINKTKNQHFVSQVEQRLNSFNPAAKKENQKIYTFNITNREEYAVNLTGNNGALIENNLSLNDLFSFDVIDEIIRENFESMFHEYERNLGQHTLALLSKLQANDNNTKSELLNIFVSKFLNFFRNPHCVEKAINTIGAINSLHPLDPYLAAICAKIESGSKPQQAYLCSHLGITSETYTKWLRILFLLLMKPNPKKPNLLEQVVKSIYENKSYAINVFVFNYPGQHADKRPLLSDRGFSSPMQENDCLAFSFNLNRNSFISYTFLDIDQKNIVPLPNGVASLMKQQSKNVCVKYIENNLEALESYNKNVIYQSKEKVYCSSKIIYGL
jgi:hypothetical protein